MSNTKQNKMKTMESMQKKIQSREAQKSPLDTWIYSGHSVFFLGGTKGEYKTY